MDTSVATLAPLSLSKDDVVKIGHKPTRNRDIHSEHLPSEPHCVKQALYVENGKF